MNGDIEATFIKVRFGNDVRKVSLHHNDDLSYDDLCIMMQRIFKIKSSTNIMLKYKDADGDLITIADDNDLMVALRTEKDLSLVVLSESADRTNMEKLMLELDQIRNSANAAFETLKAIRYCGVEPSVFGVGGSERPDTPAHKETVATIQPSVHEQVSNSLSTVSHPPAPSVHNEKPAMEVPGSQQNVISGLEHSSVAQTEKPTQQVKEEILNEPTTEIDISDKGQNVVSPVTIKQESNELDVRAPSAQINASAPPLHPSMPSAHVSAMPFVNSSQPIIQSTMQHSVSNIPSQQNSSFTPPPTQFGFQPPQPNQPSSTPPHFGAPTPQVQQIAPQFQSFPTVAPIPRLVNPSAPFSGASQASVSAPLPPTQVGLSNPVSMACSQQNIQSELHYPPSQPSSTPTMFSSASNQQMVSQPHHSYSSNSTPVPSPYAPFTKPEQTVGAPVMNESLPYQPPCSLPPSSVPPTSITPMMAPSPNVASSVAPPISSGPPLMAYSGAPGGNPFARAPQSAHYPRPVYNMPSGFQPH